MAREEIDTVIDRLLDYVNRRGTARVPDCSKSLALKPEQVENFGLMLQERGLLEVRYTVTGIELVSLKPDAKAGGEAKQDEFESKVASLEREVMRSQNLMDFFEKDLARRLLIAEKLVADMESREAYTKDELDFAKNEVEIALKQLDAFTSEVELLKLKEGGFRKQLEEFLKRLEAAKPASVSKPKPMNAVERLIFELKRALEQLKRIITGKEKLVIEATPDFQVEKTRAEQVLKAQKAKLDEKLKQPARRSAVQEIHVGGKTLSQTLESDERILAQKLKSTVRVVGQTLDSEKTMLERELDADRKKAGQFISIRGKPALLPEVGLVMDAVKQAAGSAPRRAKPRGKKAKKLRARKKR